MPAGCADSNVGFVSDALFDPPEIVTVEDADAAPLEIYSFDTAPDPQRAIFFVSGSGCASLRFFLRGYFSGLTGAYRVYSLQKAGVGPFETGATCTPAFYDDDTSGELLRRNAKALRWVEARFPGNVAALVGVSEGAELAAALAADDPKVGKLVVMGGGGLTFREDLRILAERRGQIAELNAGLASVAADPTSTSPRFLGLTNRYLASFLDVDPLPVYARVTQPILSVAGEKDESVPIESIQRLADALKARPGRNVVEVIPGASHTFRRAGSDLKPAVMGRLSRWLVDNEWPAQQL